MRLPSATQNEINAKDAQNLINNGVTLVSEGANMPTTKLHNNLLRTTHINLFLASGPLQRLKAKMVQIFDW